MAKALTFFRHHFMKQIIDTFATSGILLAAIALALRNSSFAAEYSLDVLPAEHRRMTDPKTGAELLFLSTAPEKDSNLYFHEHSWLADEPSSCLRQRG
jgi:hypothetical protein